MTARARPHDPLPSGAEVPAPRLGEMLGHLLRRTQQIHTQLWSDEVSSDITGPQYAILSAVSSYPGVDQKSAGRSASLDKSTAADVVSRLERNAWLRRERDPADARRSLLTLTAPSRTALAEVTSCVQAVQERLLGGLSTAERDEAIALLAQVAYRGDPPSIVPGAGPRAAPLVLALSTTPGHLLRRAEQVHQRAWSRHVERPTTPSQYAVLCVLARGDEDQAAVGAQASLDRSSTADIVARLHKRGLIVVGSDHTDRRRKPLSLSVDAAELLRRTTPGARAVQADITAPLAPGGGARLLHLLTRVAEAHSELAVAAGEEPVAPVVRVRNDRAASGGAPVAQGRGA